LFVEASMTELTQRRAALGILILTTTVFGAMLTPALLDSPMSVMAFDQGFSVPGVLFVSCILSFPLVILASIPGSWICYRKQIYGAAITFGVLPTLNILVVAVLFYIESTP
jgi:hypothetical protein